MELIVKNFKEVTTTMLKYIKENMFIINESIEILADE